MSSAKDFLVAGEIDGLTGCEVSSEERGRFSPDMSLKVESRTCCDDFCVLEKLPLLSRGLIHCMLLKN